MSGKIDSYFRGHLNLRHLRLLVALDDYRNVKRVAAYMNVTQPAVSKTLAMMESGMGIKLFHRTNRGMEPTMLGSSMIRHAREVLSQIHDAQCELLEINESRIGRITLGVLPTASVVVVPRFIARIEGIASATSIRVLEGTMDTLLPALRAGDIDYALGILPHSPMPIEFGSELLLEDPIVPAVRRGHPLERVDRLTWEDLAHFPMILPPTTASTRMPIDMILASENASLSARRVESVSTMSNIGTLQFTDSVGFLSSSLAQHFRDLGLLSILPLPMPEVMIRLGLIWMSERRYTETQQVVQNIFREVCRDLSARTAEEVNPTLKAARQKAARQPESHGRGHAPARRP